MKAIQGLIAAAVLCLPTTSLAAVTLVPVVSSGLSNPIFVGHAGDGSNRLFIEELGGIIRVLQPGSSVPTVFLDIHTRVLAGGEQGLLGLAFHPQYPINGRFFVYYTRSGDGAIVIAEYGVSADRNVANTTETILLTIPHPGAPNHNGGMIAFGADGFLYVGVGDGGAGDDPPNNAQNIDTLLGKILRIDVNRPDPAAGTLYSSPGDNPYVGKPGRDEIFSIGWRNPWRFSFDRVTRTQWVADVGQGAREEVDTPIVNGGNYGWRVYEGALCTGNDPTLCTPANYLFPIFDYLHSGGRCSITGGYVYRGMQGTLPLGTYVYGDFCTGEMLSWDGKTQSLLLGTTVNISSFGEDEQGELYAVGLGGSVSKIVSTTPSAAPKFQRAVSRKLHGQTSFDLPLSLVPMNPTTEPRQGPTATLVMTFDKPVTAATAAITEGIATVGVPAFSDKDVIVTLTGVRNSQYVTLALTAVTSSDGQTGGTGSVRIGFLAADVDGSRNVTLSDLLSVNAVLTQPLAAANYRRDVNANATLSFSDLLLVNANLTQFLPSP